ncbi:hypothetical protein T11_17630 [Trichinella zimbabwensis]|uniref:Uncharacterized protein n=1 Tax=Trichinella zimbabwensis TaxID=268475 RepID=A0A0V1H8F0_9BILA|nr:hypothetical protein T11_17630 [Trichinella zimbabwensis]
MWRYLYVVREGFGLGNWSLVDSGDCSRFKLVWVNASGRPKNSSLAMVNNNEQMMMMMMVLEIESGHHWDSDFTQSFLYQAIKQTDSVDSGQNSLLFLDCPSNSDQRSWS